MSDDLGTLARGWVEETRGQVAREMGWLQERMLARVDRLASDLANAPPNELHEVDGVQRHAEAYLVDAGQLFEQVADRLEGGLQERLEPLIERAEASGEAGVEAHHAVQTWGRNARHYLTFVAQYLAGYVQGGGVALGLMMELPDGLIERAVVTSIIRRRLMFAADRAEIAANQWADEVGNELLQVARRLGGEMVPDEAAPDPAEARRARLQELLALAETHQIRIKKVPDDPSDRFLDRMEEQLQAAVAQRTRAAQEADDRKVRLEELLEFAATVNVKLKKAPTNPSDAWLDKFEAKLVEVAQKRGVPLPGSVAPPTEEEVIRTPPRAAPRAEAPEPAAAPPPAPAPDAAADDDDEPDEAPAARGMSAEERRQRVEEMIAKAGKAGLDLGTVPEDPSDDWVHNTEQALEQAMAKRKAARKAARDRKKREREARIQRLGRMAGEAGIDLGPVPKFPTDDWLARMEMKVASAQLPDETEDRADDRAERLASVLQRASAADIDLGEVPPDPDRLWLTWAEGRVEDATSGDELIAAGEDPNQPQELRARLVFEEGTVQEREWFMEDGQITIGRARGNTVQVRDDSGVSRRHCTIFERDGACFVRDNGSTKGTLVDGNLIQDDTPLADGQWLQVGDTLMRFRV